MDYRDLVPDENTPVNILKAFVFLMLFSVACGLIYEITRSSEDEVNSLQRSIDRLEAEISARQKEIESNKRLIELYKSKIEEDKKSQ